MPRHVLLEVYVALNQLRLCLHTIKLQTINHMNIIHLPMTKAKKDLGMMKMGFPGRMFKENHLLPKNKFELGKLIWFFKSYV